MATSLRSRGQSSGGLLLMLLGACERSSHSSGPTSAMRTRRTRHGPTPRGGSGCLSCPERRRFSAACWSCGLPGWARS
jgi:hypothetical protein